MAKNDAVPRHPSSDDLEDLRQRLARTYTTAAEVLEQTAALADQLAGYEAGKGREAYAAHERAEAAKARDAATQLLASAERLRQSPLS